ncbi:general substrate transporter [Sphaerosporella brunnea]|uniref:Quinate transporter n=1 Tax=Sphaerosporella brunnea TaxID=1250544 RepID=A0A5J5EQ07_9PEZI|nr:general substrate transporter [Sphaerosporella brunnea]
MSANRAAETVIVPATPAEIYNWRIYTVGACACSGALIFGYNNGVIGTCITLPSFHRDFSLPNYGTSDYSYITANIVSAMQGGAFFGSLLTFPITEKIGRRFSLTIASMMFFLGSAIMTFSDGSLPMMYAGRFVGGLGVGPVSLLVPMYISELAPPDIRGFLVGMFEIGNQLSSMAGFWVNFAVQSTMKESSAQWMLSLGIQLIPGGLLFLASIFILPESPRFHVKKFKPEQALKTLVWLRQLPPDHEYVVTELGAMQQQVDRELVQAPSKLRMMRELFWRGNRNRLGMGMLLMICQNTTGINALNFYSPSIFRSIGFTGISVSLFASGMWALIKSASTILSMLFLVDRLGRRKLLILGAIGIAVTMIYIGSFITVSGVDPNHPGAKTPAAWLAIVCLYLFAVFFCIGWNSIPWIYCSEIFPNRLRSLCVSITTATQWLACFAVARATPYMLEGIRGGTYYFFGACIVLTVIWVWFCVPETKGVTLEDMDLLFGVPHGEGRDPQVTAEAQQVGDVKDEKEEVERKATDIAGPKF